MKIYTDEQIGKFLDYFVDKGIHLSGQERLIGVELEKVFDMIAENEYRCNYEKIGDVLGCDKDSFPVSCILHLLDFFEFLEYGTSARYGWIDHDVRDMFDMLHAILKNGYYDAIATGNISGGSDEELIGIVRNMLENKMEYPTVGSNEGNEEPIQPPAEMIESIENQLATDLHEAFFGKDNR